MRTCVCARAVRISGRLSEEEAAVWGDRLLFQRVEVPPAECPASRHSPVRQADGATR